MRPFHTDMSDSLDLHLPTDPWVLLNDSVHADVWLDQSVYERAYTRYIMECTNTANEDDASMWRRKASER